MFKDPKSLQDVFPQDNGSKKCGCYIRNHHELKFPYNRPMVPLKHIDYHLEIVNGLVNINLIQKYTNPSQHFLEVDFSFPISPNSSIYKFWAEFGETKIVGQVKEKEEAKKEFQKAKEQGRQAVIGSLDPLSKDVMNLEIGNIPPQTDFTLCISFLQEMSLSMNTFYRIQIPSTISPRYASNYFDMLQKDKKIAKKVSGSFTWSFKVELRTHRKAIFFDSPSHEINLLSRNQSATQNVFVMSQAAYPNKDFVFLYTTENFQLPSYVLGTNSQSSTVMLSFIPKFCNLNINDAYRASVQNKEMQTDINTAKGDYVFLLDRSGSMGGNRIQKAKEALILFLKSLPPDSYFNIVSFGSGYQTMFSNSQKYTKKTLEESIQAIKKMSADLGGTNIYQPLQKILKQKVKQGYPRQIFLLTDGGVSNTQSVLSMIKLNTKYCRVHSIGIGNGASMSLLQGSANNGKGKFIMILDNENPADKIIQLLDSTLTPLISDVKLSFDKSKVQSIVPNPQSIPYILKDDIINFYVTFQSPLIEVSKFCFEYEDSVTKKPYKADIQVNPSSKNELFVDKMGHFKAIKALQHVANNQEVQLQDYMFYVKVKDYKQQAIKQSVKHQVLSEFTAFICTQKILVDGKYQEFKDKGVNKIQIEQPKPLQYQHRMNDVLRRNPTSFNSSISNMNYKCSKVDMSINASNRMSAVQRRTPAAINLQRSSKKQAGFFSGFKGMINNLFNKSQPKCQPQLQVCSEKSKISMQSCNMPMNLSQCDSKPMKKSYSKVARSKQVQSLAPVQSLSIQEHSIPIQKSNDIQYVVNVQNIDGSWSDKSLINRLTKNKKNVLKIVDNLGLQIVLTYLVSEWIKKYHPDNQYKLLVKKAKAWLRNNIGENKEKQIKLQEIQKYI